MIISRMNSLTFKHLHQYMDKFTSLNCEFVDCGGAANDQIVHSMFLRNIPDSEFLTEKASYSGNSLQDALSYFKTLNDRKIAYRQTKPRTHRTNQVRKQKQGRTITNNNTKSKSPTAHAHLKYIKPSKVTFNKRCLRCGGFGHTADVCPSTSNSCYICGSPDHFKTECPLKKHHVKHLQIPLSFHDNNNSNTNDTDSSTESDTSGSNSDSFDELL